MSDPSNQDILLAVASQFNRPHPDELLHRLEEHSEKGWHRTSEQWIEILGVSRMPRRAYGFRFVRTIGKWYKIIKL